MNKDANQPSAARWWRWFDPSHRSVNGWGFILNRITALGLTLYLYLHLIALGQLAIGENAYQNFTSLVHNPLFIAGEILVVTAGFMHGLNGIRIVLTSLGIGVPAQKTMLISLMTIAVIASLYFAFRMFTA